MGTVLNSYLSLRRLVIQRTNLVDDAQGILLELLEELTTGKLIVSRWSQFGLQTRLMRNLITK